MKKSVQHNKKGFTIVEVSLVLAIAGLIFLMVFIALPALQRGQRDSKRREDVDTLLTSIKKYQTNNRGALPTGTGDFNKNDTVGVNDTNTWKGFLKDYTDNNFKDPSGGEFYRLSVAQCSSGGGNGNTCSGYSSSEIGSFPNDYTIYIVLQAACSGDESTGAVSSSNPRRLAALYRLEGNGVYCANI